MSSSFVARVPIEQERVIFDGYNLGDLRLDNLVGFPNHLPSGRVITLHVEMSKANRAIAVIVPVELGIVDRLIRHHVWAELGSISGGSDEQTTYLQVFYTAVGEVFVSSWHEDTGWSATAPITKIRVRYA